MTYTNCQSIYVNTTVNVLLRVFKTWFALTVLCGLATLVAFDVAPAAGTPPMPILPPPIDDIGSDIDEVTGQTQNVCSTPFWVKGSVSVDHDGNSSTPPQAMPDESLYLIERVNGDYATPIEIPLNADGSYEVKVKSVHYVIQTLYWPSGNVIDASSNWFVDFRSMPATGCRVENNKTFHNDFNVLFRQVQDGEYVNLNIEAYKDENGNNVRDDGEEGIPDAAWTVWKYATGWHEQPAHNSIHVTDSDGMINLTGIEPWDFGVLIENDWDFTDGHNVKTYQAYYTFEGGEKCGITPTKNCYYPQGVVYQPTPGATWTWKVAFAEVQYQCSESRRGSVNLPTTCTGTDGDDLIRGNNGRNIVLAGEGNDRITAGAGGDVIYGCGGNDVINAGPGRDDIYGDECVDDKSVKTSNPGIDKIYGCSGWDEIFGGPGNDILFGDVCRPGIKAVEFGNDVMYGDDGDDVMYGDGGTNTMNGGKGKDIMLGGNDKDVMKGGWNNDTMYGNGGNDEMEGGSGGDTMYGGSGHDDMDGGSGIDYMYGDDGVDYMEGGRNTDHMWGGADGDDIRGNSGSDYLYGGPGWDWMFGGKGGDTMYGEGDADNPYGTGTASKNNMYGDDDNDTIYGGSENDWLEGSDGADHLYGGNDFDILDAYTDDSDADNAQCHPTNAREKNLVYLHNRSSDSMTNCDEPPVWVCVKSPYQSYETASVGYSTEEEPRTAISVSPLLPKITSPKTQLAKSVLESTGPTSDDPFPDISIIDSLRCELWRFFPPPEFE